MTDTYYDLHVVTPTSPPAVDKLPETLRLNDGREVSGKDFVEAMTKDLVASDYLTLEEKDVEDQVLKILSGETGLSVIGYFIMDYIDPRMQYGSK